MGHRLHGFDKTPWPEIMPLSPGITKILVDASKFAGIDPLLAIAIAEVESAGDPCAVRYEPGWKYHYNVENFAKMCRITEATEHMLQACSFGIMQVMGTVARELGFEESLLKLADPRLGAKYGCMKLAKLFKVLKSVDDVIAAYNAGSPIKRDGKYINQGYVDKVRKLYGRPSNPA